MESVYETIAMDEGATEVFQHALTLAERFGGRIHVIHAVEPLSAFAQSLVENYLLPETEATIRDQRIDSLRKQMQVQLEGFCKLKTVSWERMERVATMEILDGRAEPVIMEQAHKYEADLIVMGTHHIRLRGRLCWGRWRRGCCMPAISLF